MLASHNLQHHEPISFGIDQILSCPEAPGSGLGPGRVSQAHGESAAFSGGFHGASSYGPAGSLGPLPSSSSVGPGGVIRVPAHRPLPVSPPGGGAPAVPGPSGLGGAGGLGGLTFPWMDSGRRFAKDRLTGEVAQPLQRHSSHRPGFLISDPSDPTPPSPLSYPSPSLGYPRGSSTKVYLLVPLLRGDGEGAAVDARALCSPLSTPRGGQGEVRRRFSLTRGGRAVSCLEASIDAGPSLGPREGPGAGALRLGQPRSLLRNTSGSSANAALLFLPPCSCALALLWDAPHRPPLPKPDPTKA